MGKSVHRAWTIATRDGAFFAALLAYVWAGIDPRLIYHWQGPVFYTYPGFIDEFLKYPGGPADYLHGLLAQTYVSRTAGAVALTAGLAAVVGLTHLYFSSIAARALPVLRFIPAALLLYHANLYYDRTPLVAVLVLGLSSATLFVWASRRWRSETGLLALFVILLLAVYYLAGMAIVFLATTAALTHMLRRRRPPLWIAYLLLAAALPLSLELTRFTYMPVSARSWFMQPDLRLIVVYWGLYLFYALGTVFVSLRAAALPAAPGLVKTPRMPTSPGAAKPSHGKRPAPKRRTVLMTTTLLLLSLGCVAATSYSLNLRDRRLAAIDYYSYREDWPAVIEASRNMASKDFNSLSCYEINLALHEMNRLGDEMFRFPQSGSALPDLVDSTFLPYMVRITDMCLRLGRVNEAEHFGNEALISGRRDPRLYRLLARVGMVKGQIAAARKYLTVLSYDLCNGSWARARLRELEQDPQLTGDREIMMLRRRMLRNEDMLAVWQSKDNAKANMEILLSDQLAQDPTNRMAFEFLMGSCLRTGNLEAARALMPHIKDMTGPAYVGPDGKRRTPRHYEEAMAAYAAMSGTSVNIEGLEVGPETAQRLAAFNRIIELTPGREFARQAAWNDFRDSYFFYMVFGPGDYR